MKAATLEKLVQNESGIPSIAAIIFAKPLTWTKTKLMSVHWYQIATHVNDWQLRWTHDQNWNPITPCVLRQLFSIAWKKYYRSSCMAWRATITFGAKTVRHPWADWLSIRPSTSTPPAWITPRDGYFWYLSAVDAVASAADASFLQLMSQRDIVMGVAEVYRAHRSGLSGARPLRPRRVTIIPVYTVSHNAINDPTPAMRTQLAVNFNHARAASLLYSYSYLYLDSKVYTILRCIQWFGQQLIGKIKKF